MPRQGVTLSPYYISFLYVSVPQCQCDSAEIECVVLCQRVSVSACQCVNVVGVVWYECMKAVMYQCVSVVVVVLYRCVSVGRYNPTTSPPYHPTTLPSLTQYHSITVPQSSPVLHLRDIASNKQLLCYITSSNYLKSKARYITTFREFITSCSPSHIRSCL